MKQIIFISFLFLLYTPSFAQEFDSLSSKYINQFLLASGGKDKWETVKTRWDSIHTFHYGRRNKADFKNKNSIDRKQVLRMIEPDEITVGIFKTPDMGKNSSIKSTDTLKSIMCVNQKQFWIQFGGKKAQIMPNEHKQYVKATMAHCGHAYFFLQKDASASYVAKISYKGGEYHIIKFTRKYWTAPNVYLFNTKTNLIDYATTERFLDRLGGGDVDFVRMSHLREYRNIDGFLVHTIEDGFKDSFLESRSINISTKFNIDILDTEFDLPQN